MRDDNRDTLGALIREELEVSGRGPVQVTRGWSVGNLRSFYGWKDGKSIPLARSRSMLEDALGWRRGVVTEILDAPITREFTLSDVRDWSSLPEKDPFTLREVGTEELLTELSHRFWRDRERMKSLEGEIAAWRSGERVPARESQDMYDVAANSTDPARMMEHMENDSPS